MKRMKSNFDLGEFILWGIFFVLIISCGMYVFKSCNMFYEETHPEPPVVTVEPLRIDPTTTTTVTTTTTTVTTETTAATTTTTTTTAEAPYSRMQYVGEFKGTYYRGASNPCKGGSGRELLDCTPKATEIKGSVACRFIQEEYGYDLNGRTIVWCEFPMLHQMDGFYYVDDACRDFNVIDFYFIDYSTCPWQNDGKTTVDLYIQP